MFSTLKQGRHKFALRATPHVFIGYSPQQRGYKVYNIDTKIVIVSRDVLFFERHFPFHYLNHTTSTPLPQFFLPTSTPTYTDDHPDPPLPFFNSLHPTPSTVPTTIPLNTSPLDSSVSSPILLPILPSPVSSPPPPSLCRYQRIPKQPSLLQSYQCNHVTSNHWCNLVSS